MLSGSSPAPEHGRGLEVESATGKSRGLVSEANAAIIEIGKQIR